METMLDRVQRRAESSGRTDDNGTTFDKRMFGFWNETMSLILIFQRMLSDRLIEVSFPFFYAG